LFAGYSTSFNPQIFQPMADGELPEPEEGKQLEIGWRQDWLDATLQSTVSIFEIKKKNVSIADTDNPGFSRQVGEQRSRGIELELRWNAARALDVVFAGAFTDVEVTRGDEFAPGCDQLNAVPRLTSSLWLKYQPQPRGWFLGWWCFLRR